jgi:hypothetical protein
VEHGYEDFTDESAAEYRRSWIAAGARWTDRHTTPDGLTAVERLRRIDGEQDDVGASTDD